MKQFLALFALILTTILFVSISTSASEQDLLVVPDASVAKRSLCNTFGGCGRTGKRSLCNTFGGCGRLRKRSMCNTFGGCGPARGARAYTYDYGDESGGVSSSLPTTDTGAQNQATGSGLSQQQQQQMLDLAQANNDYVDQAALLAGLRGTNQPFKQEFSYNPKPKQFFDYTY